MTDKVTPEELVEIFGGSGFGPVEACGLLMSWDHLTPAERREQFGSEDFRECLHIMARKHPVKDPVDQAADRVRQMFAMMMPMAAMSRGMYLELEALADINAIVDRYEDMRVALAEHGIQIHN